MKKNQTTQRELLERFGAPNVSTADARGVETWLYERGAGDADTLHAFFGGGGAANAGRTVTVIVEFNPDKTIRGYAVRQSTR